MSIMAGPSHGAAIFSTNLGWYAPRQPGVLPARIILRSDPDEDMEATIADLRTKYPDQCKAIQPPVANLYDYFDAYDQELHGAVFLRAVLEEISGRNLMRRERIINYTQHWYHLNPLAFQHVVGLGLNAFTSDDMETFGEEFLQDALGELQLQKIKHDDALALAYNQEHFPVHTSTHHLIRAPIPVIPQQQQQQQQQRLQSSVQRNFSDPATLYTAVARSQMPASVPASAGATPMMNQVIPARVPYSPAVQHYGPFKDDLLRPPQPSTALHPPRRQDYDINPAHINLPPSGFPNAFSPVPGPGMMPGPHPNHHVNSGSRGYNQSTNRPRNVSKAKGPVYVGPSNDARILEHQGVPRGRYPNRNHQHPSGSQMHNPRQYLPSQQGLSFRPSLGSPGPPPQGSVPPAITPSSLANGLVTEVANHDSSITAQIGDEGLQHTHKHFMPSPHVDKPDRLGGGFNGPAQPNPSPRRNAISGQRAVAPEEPTPAETTPPRTMQRTSVTDSVGSPTLRRLSNAGGLSHGANLAPQYTQNYPGARAPRWDKTDYPLSDRKIWVGGLRPGTDIVKLVRLLEPFGPFQLKEILVSGKCTDTDTKGEFAGYTFVDFQFPQKATDAVANLHGRMIDSLQCKLLLRPARVHPKYNDNLASPRKNNYGPKAYTDGQKPHETGENHQKHPNEREPQLPPNPPMQSPSSRYQQSAEWPPPGKNDQHSHEACGLTSASESYGAQDKYEPNLPTQADTSKERGPGGNHEFYTESSRKVEPPPSGAMKPAAAAIASSTLESPSSASQKEKGRMDHDEPPSEKVPQAKERKGMLANLRMEKPNVTASKIAVGAPDSHKDRQTDATGAVQVSNTDKVQLPGKENITELSGISASDLKEELEKYAAPPSDGSGGRRSRVHSVSTSRRRPSSGSLFMSTDPTSYAHSEQSESSKDRADTPVTPKNQDQLLKASPTLAAPIIQKDQLAHTLAEPSDTQLLKTYAETIDEAIVASRVRSESPITIKEVQKQDQTISTPPTSISAANMQPSEEVPYSDSAPEPDASFVPELKGRDQFPLGDPHHVESLRSPEKSLESSDQPSKKKDVHLDNLVHSEDIPRLSPAIPMRDVSPNTRMQSASGPLQKRGLTRDPKTLVAVPYLLSPMRRIGKTDTQAPSPFVNLTPSSAPHSPSKSVITHSGSAAKELKDSTKPGLAPMAQAGPDRAVTPPVAKDNELPPVTSNIPDPQPGSTLSNSQNQSEGLDASSELASMPDSVATLEADNLDSAHGTPQLYPTVIIDLEEDVGPNKTSEQHPVVQQKKRKGKKPKKSKKSKPSPASSASGSSPTHSRSSTKEEIKIPVVVPKVETPYLADDNTPLPQPAFVRQNHSSMLSRRSKPPALETLILFNPVDVILVRDSKNQQLALKNGGNGSTVQVRETYANLSSNSAFRSPGLIVYIICGESSDQHVNDKPTGVGSPPIAGVDQRGFSQEEQQARLRRLDEHAQEKNLAPIHELLQVLAIVAPQGSRSEIYEQDVSSEPLSSKGLAPCAELSGPRISEIFCDDEAQSSSLPSTIYGEHAQGSISASKPSGSPLFVGKSVGEFEAAQGVKDIDQWEPLSQRHQPEEHEVGSFPSTRTVSPAPIRGRSPTKSLGMSATRPPSVNSENISPSRIQRPGTMCWREAVVKSSAPSIRMGDIVEVTTKGTDNKGKGVPGRDPWRVPSAEQEWGANSKSRGKSLGEASNTKK